MSATLLLISSPFTAIGVGIVTFLICLLIGELNRAIRQSHRVATVAVRAGGGPRRKITYREWRRAFKREFGSSYSSLIIRFVEIPHDPSKPLRARLPA